MGMGFSGKQRCQDNVANFFHSSNKLVRTRGVFICAVENGIEVEGGNFKREREREREREKKG